MRFQTLANVRVAGLMEDSFTLCLKNKSSSTVLIATASRKCMDQKAFLWFNHLRISHTIGGQSCVEQVIVVTYQISISI